MHRNNIEQDHLTQIIEVLLQDGWHLVRQQSFTLHLFNDKRADAASWKERSYEHGAGRLVVPLSEIRALHYEE